MLRAAGVPLLIGSDLFRQTADEEVQALRELGLMDGLELLRAWCETTPKSIFPGRAIGRIAEGHEASFLVLEGDPLEDFANTQRIALHVKRGRLLFPRAASLPQMGR